MRRGRVGRARILHMSTLMSDRAPTIEARSGPRRSTLPPPRLVIVAATALAAFAALGGAISSQATTSFDASVRRWALGANGPVCTSVFSLLSTVGSVTPMIVYACVLGALVAIYRRSATPLTIVGAPLLAVFAYLGTKAIFLRTRPSGVGNAFEGTYSFPSAHATTSSAVCFGVAYLLHREGLVSGAVAATAAALVTLVIGVSRVYLDVHWATDVLGGWFLGAGIGAATAALYEAANAAVGRTVSPSVQ